jgi:hypothetical protein
MTYMEPPYFLTQKASFLFCTEELTSVLLLLLLLLN